MAEEQGGIVPTLSRTLRAITEAALAPWAVLRPGARVSPLEMRPADEASQAPTREATPGPEAARRRTPTPAPRPVRIPEAVREEPEPEPERKRRRRAAPPRPQEGEPNWRRPLEPEPEPQARPGPQPRTEVAPAALAMVRRARAWRAREGRPPSRVTPSAYDAVDADGRFGLIECTGDARPLPGAGQTLLLAHAPPRRGTGPLQGLCQGQTVRVVSTRPGAGGWSPLRIQFVTRAGYVAPGRAVTSVALGVATAEWRHALLAQPEPAPRPREPTVRGGDI
jgi:hypothetical protein